MNSTELEKKMNKHREEFRKLIDKISKDVIEFSEKNKEKTTYDLNTTDNFSDEIIQYGGWIKDRINGTLKSEKPRKSLVVKLRRSLGFTYP